MSVAGSDPEPSTVEELREAAVTLLEARGTAVVTATDGEAETIATVDAVVQAFRTAGVPTRQG